jgi:hypothetical protein
VDGDVVVSATGEGDETGARLSCVVDSIMVFLPPFLPSERVVFSFFFLPMFAESKGEKNSEWKEELDMK